MFILFENKFITLGSFVILYNLLIRKNFTNLWLIIVIIFQFLFYIKWIERRSMTFLEDANDKLCLGG